MNEHEAGLPDGSAVLYVTGVTPIVKLEPLAMSEETARDPVLSVATASDQETEATANPGSVTFTMSVGQVMLGASSSAMWKVQQRQQQV